MILYWDSEVGYGMNNELTIEDALAELIRDVENTKVNNDQIVKLRGQHRELMFPPGAASDDPVNNGYAVRVVSGTTDDYQGNRIEFKLLDGTESALESYDANAIGAILAIDVEEAIQDAIPRDVDFY